MRSPLRSRAPWRPFSSRSRKRPPRVRRTAPRPLRPTSTTTSTPPAPSGRSGRAKPCSSSGRALRCSQPASPCLLRAVVSRWQILPRAGCSRRPGAAARSDPDPDDRYAGRCGAHVLAARLTADQLQKLADADKVQNAKLVAPAEGDMRSGGAAPLQQSQAEGEGALPQRRRQVRSAEREAVASAWSGARAGASPLIGLAKAFMPSVGAFTPSVGAFTPSVSAFTPEPVRLHAERGCLHAERECSSRRA